MPEVGAQRNRWDMEGGHLAGDAQHISSKRNADAAQQHRIDYILYKPHVHMY